MGGTGEGQGGSRDLSRVPPTPAAASLALGAVLVVHTWRGGGNLALRYGPGRKGPSSSPVTTRFSQLAVRYTAVLGLKLCPGSGQSAPRSCLRVGTAGRDPPGGRGELGRRHVKIRGAPASQHASSTTL